MIITSKSTLLRAAVSALALTLIMLPVATHAADAPSYSCDSLTVTKLNGEQGRKVQIRPNYTASDGVKLKTITYDFGDQTTPLTTNKPSVQYTYPDEVGAYRIIVSLRMTVGNKEQVGAGDKCTNTVLFETAVPGGTTKSTTPDSLPETGAGGTVGLFVGVTALGTLAHRFYSKRRLARDYQY